MDIRNLCGNNRTMPPPEPIDRIRWPFALLAYLSVGLALVGVFLPGIPTVPFLLLAAWAADRGSRRLHDWIHNHRHLGPPLRQWQEQRAITSRAKATAVTLMTASWLIMVWRTDTLWVPVVTGLLFIAVGSYLLSRPTPT